MSEFEKVNEASPAQPYGTPVYPPQPGYQPNTIGQGYYPTQPVQPPAAPQPQAAPQPTAAPQYSAQAAPRPEAAVPATSNDRPTSKKGSSRLFWKRFCVAAVAVAVLLGSNVLTAFLLGSSFDQKLQHTTQQLEQKLASNDSQPDSGSNNAVIQTAPAEQGPSSTQNTGTAMTPSQVYAQNVASVVLIKSQVQNYYGPSGYSTGSGFVLSENGFVVTNYHVVEGGSKLTVITSDGKEYDAVLIGGDDANDVALLKIEATGLSYVTIGNSDSLIVGDQVVAIGNPLGELTSTLTVGYVSAKERDVNTSGFAINMIQTDAAINSGNSGGPLFDMQGNVVGITSAKYSGNSGNGATIEGIGFAIPINDVMPLLQDLVTNGKETTPYLGVTVKDMDSATASAYNMPVGAYVDSVQAGGPAANGGLRAGDIITGVGDHEVVGVNSLTQALRYYRAGQTVELTVFSSGRLTSISVTLAERPQEETTAQAPTQPQPDQSQGQEYDDWFDFLFPGLQ